MNLLLVNKEGLSRQEISIITNGFFGYLAIENTDYTVLKISFDFLLTPLNYLAQINSNRQE